MNQAKSYGALTMDLLQLYDNFKPTLKTGLIALPASAILLVGSTLGFKTAGDFVNSYCRDSCKISVGNFEIRYDTRLSQKIRDDNTKTIETFVK